jgi:cytochrome c oxidase subunit II
MNNVIRSIVVTTIVVIAWAGSAGAQGGSGKQDTGNAATGNTVAPAVPEANKGAAQGTGPAGTQAQPGAMGSAATPDTAPTGTLAPAGTGAGSAAAPSSGGVAWYDKLANKDIGPDEEGTFWMPRSVNSAADESDIMFYSVLALSAFFFIAIAFAVVYLTIKYRHRPGHKPQPSAAHNDAMEITWTVIPTIITVFLFWYGWRSYINVVTPPQKAVEVDVLAWRWNWQFTHANGVTDSDLHVPVNTPVRLVMTSKDVLHAFYAPAMRVKQDIVPRRYTYSWFNATKPGTYRLTCAEYCGTSHAQMACLQTDKHTGACLRRAVVVVHAPGDYERYLADKEAESSQLPPEELGKKLYEKKGCNACHTVDGTPRVGPSFYQQFGTTISLADGSKVPMDENYIRESLMSPQAKGRPGFPPSMPSFEGQLKEVEITGLIAYIKSLK